MADQEIESKIISSDAGQIEKNLGEERESRCSDKSMLARVPVPYSSLAEAPIRYQYLTFETELPTRCTTRLLDQDASSSPAAPCLQEYQSPFTWSESRKTYTTYLLCAMAVAATYSAGSYSLVSAQLCEYWGISQMAVLFGITTFTSGFAIAPMILAPFSEIDGRYPVFVATGILFVACQLFCAITRSYPGMLVARFFLGVGGSTFSSMVGGVVSDMYHSEDRNRPMALFTG